MRKRTQAREFALQLLYQYEINPDDIEKTFQIFWESNEAAPDVREFAERLVRGTLSNLKQIDQIVMKYAENWQLHRMAAVDRNILRFAAYEIIFCEDVPPKVTINEAVNIAKKFSQEDSGKFVNGVLDKIGHAERSSSLTPRNPE